MFVPYNEKVFLNATQNGKSTAEVFNPNHPNPELRRWELHRVWPEAEFEAAKNSYSAPGCCAAAIAYYHFLSPKVPPGQRKRLGMPSLIVGGVTDGALGTSDFEGSTRRFTGPVDVKMLPGGHFLHREHPEPFLEVLLPFLQA